MNRKKPWYYTAFAVSIPVAIICIFAVLPVAWAFITSIKSSAEIHVASVRYWPQHPTLENYVDVFKTTDFVTQFKNSAIVSLSTTVLCVILSVTADGHAPFLREVPRR